MAAAAPSGGRKRFASASRAPGAAGAAAASAKRARIVNGGAESNEEDSEGDDDGNRCTICAERDDGISRKEGMGQANWLACDRHGDQDAWFHCACVGISDAEYLAEWDGHKEKTFYCPRCTRAEMKPLPGGFGSFMDWKRFAKGGPSGRS